MLFFGLFAHLEPKIFLMLFHHYKAQKSEVTNLLKSEATYLFYHMITDLLSKKMIICRSEIWSSDGFRWFQFYWQKKNARNNSNYNKTEQSQLCIEWKSSGNIYIIITIRSPLDRVFLATHSGCWLVAVSKLPEPNAFVKSLENEVV